MCDIGADWQRSLLQLFVCALRHLLGLRWSYVSHRSLDWIWSSTHHYHHHHCGGRGLVSQTLQQSTYQRRSIDGDGSEQQKLLRHACCWSRNECHWVLQRRSRRARWKEIVLLHCSRLTQTQLLIVLTRHAIYRCKITHFVIVMLYKIAILHLSFGRLDLMNNTREKCTIMTESLIQLQIATTECIWNKICTNAYCWRSFTRHRSQEHNIYAGLTSQTHFNA